MTGPHGRRDGHGPMPISRAATRTPISPPPEPSHLTGHTAGEVARILAARLAREAELAAQVADEYRRQSRPVGFDDPYAPVGSPEGIRAWHEREGVRPRWNPDLDEEMPSMRNQPDGFSARKFRAR